MFALVIFLYVKVSSQSIPSAYFLLCVLAYFPKIHSSVSSSVCLCGGETDGILLHYSQIWPAFPPQRPPRHYLPRIYWLCNFHVVFGHIGQNLFTFCNVVCFQSANQDINISRNPTKNICIATCSKHRSFAINCGLEII